VRWVVMIAPIGVFALVLPLAAHSGTAFAGAISFYIVAYSAANLAMTALLYPVVALAGNLPMRRFAPAALPPPLIAFSSSSSVASLPALVESAERSLGLPSRVTGFVLPLAVSTFRVAGPLSWTVAALFVAWFYRIPLHTTDLATIAFAAVFLAFVAPGVPRGAFIMLTPLFLAIGLPAEGIGILIAADVIPDTFSTVLNVTGDLAAAVLVARAESNVASNRQFDDHSSQNNRDNSRPEISGHVSRGHRGVGSALQTAASAPRRRCRVDATTGRNLDAPPMVRRLPNRRLLIRVGRAHRAWELHENKWAFGSLRAFSRLRRNRN